ncbi:hypothetical protein Tco_0814562 [Tanacetum coccineum]
MTFINANVLSNIVSLQCLSSLLNALLQNTMAEQNVPTQPPTRTDEQIVPRSQWLTIGKSNLLFNAQKIQKNPIFQISVDILSNTNFFQAFTASPQQMFCYLLAIILEQNEINEKTELHPFELPPSGNTVIDFVNELGYPEPVEIVSNIRVNYVYQPWRAILTLINQCLTGKTSGEAVWGQSLLKDFRSFFSHKASHKASLKNPKKKVTPLLILYGRFSKMEFGSASNEKGKRGEGEGDDADMYMVSMPDMFNGSNWTVIFSNICRFCFALELFVGIRPLSLVVTSCDEWITCAGDLRVAKFNFCDMLWLVVLKCDCGIAFIVCRGVIVYRDPHDSTTGPSSQPEDDTSKKVIHESSSTSNSERTESEEQTESEIEAVAPKGDKDQG